MHFPGLEKSWILGKMAKVMEKSSNYIFWPKDFVLFSKLENFTLSLSKTMPPKV